MVAERLTQHRVDALEPGRNTRDGRLKGFGVRILLSGRKRFLVPQPGSSRCTGCWVNLPA
ncbi:MAG: hypothetical protein OXQ84_01775 [bacterium]|nr:hypothetical protein [bacterium]